MQDGNKGGEEVNEQKVVHTPPISHFDGSGGSYNRMAPVSIMRPR